MKKYLLLLLCVIMCFVIIASANNNQMSEEDALILGERKYASFLWMIRGAFQEEEYVINDKKVAHNLNFSCDYKDSKDECLGVNFIDSFKEVFSKKISYNKVYGDGAFYKWYSEKDNEYYFHYPNYCKINELVKEYYLKVNEITKDKISYIISTDSNNRPLVLIREDGDWKIGEAFYLDKCHMEYSIA